MKNFYFTNFIKQSFLLLVFALSFSGLHAQLSGTLTIPGSYSTIAEFVTDLNLQGVGPGGVTVNVDAGHIETSSAVIVMTATGTFSDPIVIQKSGIGANPIITSYTGGTGTPGSANQDGIFALVGSDYVTIDGIDLMENASNTSNPSTMEYGYGMFKASATDGCQFNIIKNCTITLSRVNNANSTLPSFEGSRGINVTNSLISSQITSVTVTASSGSNSNNQFYSNTLQNLNYGIVLSGFAATSPFTLGDTGNDIGGLSLLTGNTIINFGGATSATNPSAGIRTSNQWSQNVSYNTINNNTGGGVNHVNTLRGILIGNATSANATINNNTLTVVSGATTSQLDGISSSAGSTAASNTININNNLVQLAYSTATSAVINGIINSGTPTTLNINGNTITNVSTLPTIQNILGGTGTLVMIEGGSPTNLNINNNLISTFARTGLSGNFRVIKITSPSNTIIDGNTIENIAYSTSTSTGSIDGIYSLSSAVNVTISNNIVRNLSTPTTGTLRGINEFGVNGTKIINKNQIYGFATTIGGAGGATLNGISSSVGTVTISENTIYSLISSGSTGGTAGTISGISISSTSAPWLIEKNKIYTLSSTTTFSGQVATGILASSGGGTIVNNIISDLNAYASPNTDAVRGISITSTSTLSSIKTYFNSIYLNATSTGANFGSTGIFHTVSATATTATLDLQNNIIINESAFNGTGLTVAYRRSGASFANYATSSNRNKFYAGIPSASKLIFTNGTTQQTLGDFQIAVGPTREANSITGEGFTYGTPGSFFISLTGASVDFLRPVAGITTQVESGAINLSPFTTDYPSVIRAGNIGYTGTGTNPDMGAYEFEGISPAPSIVLNSVTPSTASQCVASSRFVSVTITNPTSSTTGATLNYSFNGTGQTPIVMTNPSGDIWEATIPVASPVNAIVTWSITASNTLPLSSTYIGTSYADEPLFGATATASASNATVCANDASQLSATLTKSGTSVSGTGTGTSNASPNSPYHHSYGGAKTQYIFRASELTAMGFMAGNITALSLNVTTLGTSPLNGFTLNMGHTLQNAAVTNTAIVSGLTQVYSSAAQVLTIGTNNYILSTPFNWDGTSNIVLSFTWSNVNSGGTSSTVTTDPALSFTSSLAILADNATSACLLSAVSSVNACFPTFTTNSTSSVRPTITFTGNKAPAITSVQWMDGATPVGTGNPLTVNPTTTTTYSANITAAGCLYSPSPTTTITVNPLPTAPTATNSAQCGTQVPTASVTSTTVAVTPTFKWYDAAVAGSVMQASTSTTYTSNVATTTTFYVSEVDGSTLCESPRTAITVTVASADNIAANASASTICIGTSVTLTASNTNPTPNQTYSYTWSGLANSGAETPVAGSSVSITPLQPGSYIYDLTGVDGLCNAFTQISITVNPFVASISAINATCNGVANGSFSQGSSSCGTLPYTYSVDAGAYGAIPTDLAAGSYTVIVKDANGYLSAALPLTITQPSTTISNPTVTPVSVCQNVLSAMVSANSTSTGSVVVPFGLTGQPTEVSAPHYSPTLGVNPNVISTATLPALPAGAVVTSVSFSFPGLTAIGGSWRRDVFFGFSGSGYTAEYLYDLTAPLSAGSFNFSNTSYPTGAINVNGGTINLNYFDGYNDNGGAECTFPIGSTVANLTINYSLSPTISWWDASTNGTQIGTGSPFETVGTSILPNTATPGNYTFYAQGQNGACPSPGRTPVNVTVKANSTNTITATACNSYTLNTQTYTTTGSYMQTLTNAVGCDSIITLNLTINNSSTSTTTITACNTYTWTNAITYTTTGIYSQTLTNAAGCDSVATLDLTINNSNTGTDVISACNSYTWIDGVTYFSSNNSSTFTLTNAAGCDSVVTMNLTIGYPNTGTAVITTCDSYTWINGVTYTANNNSATYTLTNASGCDSIVTLDLTINSSNSGTAVITACDSYTWIDGVTYTADNNSATFTLTNETGCDSIVTLNLTINISTTSLTTITMCDSYTWTNSITYTSTGIYTQALTNAAGCDSIATLNLTINTSPVATAVDNGNATITASAGSTYEWIDCGTGLTIGGANSQTFAPTVNGSYQVTVTNAAGCSNTSSCVVINYIGIKEIVSDIINVYPNPTRDFVTINMTSATATIEVIDAQGKILQISSIENGEKINLSDYVTGIYIFRIKTDNGTTIHRISKN